jgi:hypothetical protein
MIQPASLDLALKSLATSDWDGYVSHLRQELEVRESLWAELGRKHGKEIDLLERVLAWPAEKSRRRVLTYLLPALGYADLLSHEVLKLLKFASVLDGAAVYQVGRAIRPTFSRSFAVAREVGDAVRHESSFTPVIGIWTSAYAQAAPQDAAAYARDLPTATAQQREVVAGLLGSLDTSQADVSAVLAPEADRLLTAVLQDAPATGDVSDHWNAVRALARFHAPAMEALIKAANAGQVPALMVLVHWLTGQMASTVGATATPLPDIIDLLLRSAISNVQLRDPVDSHAASLVYNQTLRPVVLGCVNRLAESDVPVATMFEQVFSAINENGEFGAVLTDWLLSARVSVQAIRSLLLMCAVGNGPIVLNASQFMAAPEERRIVACRRLLTLTMDGPVLCEFIGLLAEDPALQPAGLEYASQMLPAVMEEFPGAAESFLRLRTRSDRRRQPYAALYRGVFARALHWRRILERLPERGELRPSDHELHVLNARRQWEAQEAMRVARERSFFRHLATTVHTAQGMRFVSHHEHGTSAISGMAALSHSIELPSSEVRDPVRASMHRRLNLRASR